MNAGKWEPLWRELLWKAESDALREPQMWVWISSHFVNRILILKGVPGAYVWTVIQLISAPSDQVTSLFSEQAKLRSSATPQTSSKPSKQALHWVHRKPGETSALRLSSMPSSDIVWGFQGCSARGTHRVASQHVSQHGPWVFACSRRLDDSRGWRQSPGPGRLCLGIFPFPLIPRLAENEESLQILSQSGIVSVLDAKAPGTTSWPPTLTRRRRQSQKEGLATDQSCAGHWTLTTTDARPQS